MLKVLKCNTDIFYINNMKILNYLSKCLQEYANRIVNDYKYRHRK